MFIRSFILDEGSGRMKKWVQLKLSLNGLLWWKITFKSSLQACTQICTFFPLFVAHFEQLLSQL